MTHEPSAPRAGETHHRPFAGSAAVYRDDVERSFAFVRRGLDHFARAKALAILAVLAAEIGDPKTIRLLDIGCGVGVLGAVLSPQVGEMHGVDVAPDMVEQAARNDPRGRYRWSGGPALPYPDASFDAAVAVNVLHHVPPPQRPGFVASARAVVRPGGLVLAIEHNPWNPLTRLAVRRCALDDECELLTRRDVSELLTAAGLGIATARFILFSPWGPLGALDRALGWLPLGAQHLVAGRVR